MRECVELTVLAEMSAMYLGSLTKAWPCGQVDTKHAED